jgi:hypothetical protein
LDELTGNGPFFVERMFHFAPGILSKVQDEWHWLANGRAWNMVNVSTTELQEEIVIGRETPPLGWFAEYRGKLVESPTLRQYGSVEHLLRCTTVVASDHIGKARAEICSNDPGSGENCEVLKLNIGSLVIRTSTEGCEFSWLIPQ